MRYRRGYGREEEFDRWAQRRVQIIRSAITHITLEPQVTYLIRWEMLYCGEEMHKAVVDIVRSITEGYQVFTFLKRHVGRWKSRTERKYESANGLADDLHTLLSAYRTEDCFLGKQYAVLFSRGHHRQLIDYLEQNCWRGKRRRNRYWSGDLWIRAYLDVPQEHSGIEVLQWGLHTRKSPDLQIQFGWGGLNIVLPCKKEPEEQYIQGIIAAACEKYGLDTEWEV